jgi:hypothetical protein
VRLPVVVAEQPADLGLDAAHVGHPHATVVDVELLGGVVEPAPDAAHHGLGELQGEQPALVAAWRAQGESREGHPGLLATRTLNDRNYVLRWLYLGFRDPRYRDLVEKQHALCKEHVEEIWAKQEALDAARH